MLQRWWLCFVLASLLPVAFVAHDAGDKSDSNRGEKNLLDEGRIETKFVSFFPLFLECSLF